MSEIGASEGEKSILITSVKVIRVGVVPSRNWVSASQRAHPLRNYGK